MNVLSHFSQNEWIESYIHANSTILELPQILWKCPAPANQALNYYCNLQSNPKVNSQCHHTKRTMGKEICL